MADIKWHPRPGTLLRMRDGWGGAAAWAPGRELGPAEGGAFFATALGGGRILAPDSSGEMRVWKSITFWAPGTGGTEGGSATWRGSNESWLHADIAETE